MNNPTQHEARRLVLEQILHSAVRDQKEADQIRQAQHRAELLDVAVHLKRQVAAALNGEASIPQPDQVHPVGELGMVAGLQMWALPEDATYEDMEQYAAFTEQLYSVALNQFNRVRDLMREHRSTLETGVLAPEWLPEPDPLTAAPAEVSGAWGVPPEVGPEHGDCVRCGRLVRLRAPNEWVHAEDGSAIGSCHVSERDELYPYREFLAKRVVIRAKTGARSHGVLRVSGIGGLLVLDPCEDGEPEIAAADVETVAELPPRADAGIWQREDLVPGYPEEPAVAAAPPADPAEVPEASGLLLRTFAPPTPEVLEHVRDGLESLPPSDAVTQVLPAAEPLEQDGAE